MNQPDVFYLTASISIVILSALIVFIGIMFFRLLKRVQNILDLIEDPLKDFVTIKNGFKYGLSGILTLFLKSFVNQSSKIGGDKNEQ
jgi:hypothetical protein